MKTGMQVYRRFRPVIRLRISGSTFICLEDLFSSIMNNIPSVEDMNPDNDYHVFREGIKPAWEDPENARGGSFVINCVDKSAPIYWINSVHQFIINHSGPRLYRDAILRFRKDLWDIVIEA